MGSLRLDDSSMHLADAARGICLPEPLKRQLPVLGLDSGPTVLSMKRGVAVMR